MRDTTREHDVHRARIVALVAATAMSLACGTNYSYSAWAPQFADRLRFSSTESNLIGLWGNLGMYALGIPVGLLIDTRGPRPAVIMGMILLALGYFPLHEAYDLRTGSVALMCFFSSLTGLGGCMCFTAAMKTSAQNWPHHRGTATAFPLAAFGLSAFFFSTIGAVFFDGDTSSYLMLLACGTSGLIFVGSFFLRVLPHPGSYEAVPSADESSAQQHRKPSLDDRAGSSRSSLQYTEPGMSSGAAPPAGGLYGFPREDIEASPPATGPFYGSDPEAFSPDDTRDETATGESSSLISSLPGDILVQSSVDMGRSHRVDIRGVRMLPMPRFWQLLTLLGLLSGVGLMTINNIGNVVKALWRSHDDSLDEATIVKNQQMHVSILSLCSFAGRLLSGVGSDFLVKVVRANRLWCIVIASSVFSLAQLCAVSIANPHLVGAVSGLSGLGYGFLFGVFPSIVAETFGIHGLSQNWGFMTLAPGVSGNVFNLIYGKVYDQHSIVEPGGKRVCPNGLGCYRTAYLVTLGASVIGLVLALWVIRRERSEALAETKEDED